MRVVLKIVTKMTCFLFLIGSVLPTLRALASEDISTPESRISRSLFVMMNKYGWRGYSVVSHANFLVESKVEECDRLLEQGICSSILDCSWDESESRCLVQENKKDEIFDRELIRMDSEAQAVMLEQMKIGLLVLPPFVLSQVAIGILLSYKFCLRTHLVQVAAPARPV